MPEERVVTCPLKSTSLVNNRGKSDESVVTYDVPCSTAQCGFFCKGRQECSLVSIAMQMPKTQPES